MSLSDPAGLRRSLKERLEQIATYQDKVRLFNPILDVVFQRCDMDDALAIEIAICDAANQQAKECQDLLADPVGGASPPEDCIYEICGCSSAHDGHCMMCTKPITEHRLIPRNELEEIERRLLASASPAPGWHPIETAPKDGTQLLLWCNRQIVSGYWNQGSVFHMPHWGRPQYTDEPTYWMPLPDPPAASSPSLEPPQ
jgi:hypothetical protein